MSWMSSPPFTLSQLTSLGIRDLSRGLPGQHDPLPTAIQVADDELASTPHVRLSDLQSLALNTSLVVDGADFPALQPLTKLRFLTAGRIRLEGLPLATCLLYRSISRMAATQPRSCTPPCYRSSPCRQSHPCRCQQPAFTRALTLPLPTGACSLA